jgi:hypothetical protein
MLSSLCASLCTLSTGMHTLHSGNITLELCSLLRAVVLLQCKDTTVHCTTSRAYTLPLEMHIIHM